MLNIIKINFNKSVKDIYLLFWSILMPFLVLFGLTYFHITVTSNILLGIIAISLFFYCCTTNAFAIFSQRKRGVFDLLTITPFSIYKYLISVSVTQVLIGVCTSVVLLIAENTLFHLQFNILQFVLCLPILILASFIFTFMGFTLSALPKNEGQLSITSNLVMIPLLLCSHLFLDLSRLPKVIYFLSFLNPMEWLLNGFTAVHIQQLKSYLISLLILILFFIGTLILAVKSFRVKN